MTQADSQLPATMPPPQPRTVANTQTGDSDDHLQHLFKMSTTAGLGSQEYVAVNILAVIAVLFGVGSLLALLSNALLVIPLTGIVLALISLRQIVNSNGTQTGKGMAILGLAFSVLIGGGSLGHQSILAMRQRQDQRAIDALFQKFGQLISVHKYDEAYDLFDGDFKLRVQPDAFKARMIHIQEDKNLAPIDETHWNGLADFQNANSEEPTALAVMRVHFRSGSEPRIKVRVRKTGENWQFDTMEELFPPLKANNGNNNGGQ